MNVSIFFKNHTGEKRLLIPNETNNLFVELYVPHNMQKIKSYMCSKHIITDRSGMSIYF